jgi:hypothetical protein
VGGAGFSAGGGEELSSLAPSWQQQVSQTPHSRLDGFALGSGCAQQGCFLQHLPPESAQHHPGGIARMRQQVIDKRRTVRFIVYSGRKNPHIQR